MKLTDIIKKWFEEFLGGSLVLPDGWHGRPYDNQHMLTSIIESDSKLEIVLDDVIKLQFENLKKVEVKEGELVFSCYEKMRFSWEPYADGSCGGFTRYNTGEVKIVPGSG